MDQDTDWQRLAQTLEPYWEKLDAAYRAATGDNQKDAALRDISASLLLQQRALTCQNCHPVAEIYLIHSEIQRSLTGLACSRHQGDFLRHAAAHGLYPASLLGKPGRFFRRVPPGHSSIPPGRYSLKEIGELLHRHRFQPEVIKFLATVLQQ